MPVGGGASTVLVVEDEPPLRELLVDLLREEGYAVAEAADGEAAIAAVEGAPPQSRIRLVLLDMMLPRVDGVGVLRRVCHLNHDAPAIIAMSASQERLRDARAAGATETMAKPLDLEQLLEAIARYCA